MAGTWEHHVWRMQVIPSSVHPHILYQPCAVLHRCDDIMQLSFPSAIVSASSSLHTVRGISNFVLAGRNPTLSMCVRHKWHEEGLASAK